MRAAALMCLISSPVWASAQVVWTQPVWIPVQQPAVVPMQSVRLYVAPPARPQSTRIERYYFASGPSSHPPRNSSQFDTTVSVSDDVVIREYYYLGSKSAAQPNKLRTPSPEEALGADARVDRANADPDKDGSARQEKTGEGTEANEEELSNEQQNKGSGNSESKNPADSERTSARRPRVPTDPSVHDAVPL